MQKYMVRTATGLGSSCGACKFLRRKCTADCIFAPYFSYDQAATHFAAVHKVFGASNVSRLLLHLPVQSRSDAAITVSYEALARMHDPVYGCVAQIFALQQQVASLQDEIDKLSNMMANSPVGAAISGGSSQASTSRNTDGIDFTWQQDASNTQLYHNQLSTLFSHQESGVAYQGLEGQVNLGFPDTLQFEDHVFDESDPNSLEKLLSGIDQQVFINHP
ncbi:LOB domain-containing protein 29-like [Neltuma alba]|uniref:LOB domain-containing protein 29-like n=1 Tax=Neltuma alba TaxID=207710 RepID=UPI0010A2C709|nr:LOB domain-containing protein 29-like [Prosopis alba]XP_028791672.1 LOB domain-containing protein 29-like [Prosopis alba]